MDCVEHKKVEKISEAIRKFDTAKLITYFLGL